MIESPPVSDSSVKRLLIDAELIHGLSSVQPWSLDPTSDLENTFNKELMPNLILLGA